MSPGETDFTRPEGPRKSCWYSMLVHFTGMGSPQKVRKITVEVPERLFQRAKLEGEGVSDVVRSALELRASQQAWQRLARWSGRVKWSISLEELRED